MHRRVLGLLILVPLLVGLRPVDAQQAPPLSQTGRALVRYLPVQTDLPPEFRFLGPPAEGSNEEIVAGNPDIASLVLASNRMIEVGVSARGPSPLPAIGMFVGAFLDAEGAWHYASEQTFPIGVQTVERTIPGPEVGERSAVYSWSGGTAAAPRENLWLIVQRDRLALEVLLTGTPGSVSVEDILPIARQMDAKVLATPPGAPAAADLALIEQPTPTVVTRGAVRILLQGYVEELNVADLFTEVWQGAAQALRRAGVADVPASPIYPSDEEAAVALHMQSFPVLERLASGRLTDAQLAYAGINEMVRVRNDCHTRHLTPLVWERSKAALTGGEQVLIGVGFAMDAPLRIVRTSPGSAAQAAGLRRGQVVLAINGKSVSDLPVTEARALIDPTEGVPTTFTVQEPSGRVQEVTVAPTRFREPPLEAMLLPGNIGLIRMYGLEIGDRQIDLVRETLTDFESQGLEGWLFDFRANSGGSAATSVNFMSLFVEGGRLSGSIVRGREPVFSMATGNVLPFQRPMLFLVGPGSGSAGEIIPGVLNARGRAVLAGERTAGCIGSTRVGNGLLDGSVLDTTASEGVIGPDALRYHRVGVPVNIEIPPSTPEDDEVGRDPQLDRAADVLRELIGQPGTPAPAPMPSNATTLVIDI